MKRAATTARYHKEDKKMTIETRILTKNGKALTVREATMFKDMDIGSLFVFADDDSDCPKVWVKTPFADMCEHNNKMNQNGAFCNALCINSKETHLYIQCFPEAQCFMIDTDGLFGTASE